MRACLEDQNTQAPRILRIPRLTRTPRTPRMPASLPGHMTHIISPWSTSQPPSHLHPHLHPRPRSRPHPVSIFLPFHLLIFSGFKTIEDDEVIESPVIQSAWRFKPFRSDWIEEFAHDFTILRFSALRCSRSTLSSSVQKSSTRVPYRSTGELLLLRSQRGGSIGKKH